MFNIKGLGEVKINKYGNDILRIIKEHTSTEFDLNQKISNEVNINKEYELRNKLKEFRTETAKKEKLRPFMIFKDDQIDELIKAKPKTKEQLLKVRGFGEIKAEKYGERIITIFK